MIACVQVRGLLKLYVIRLGLTEALCEQLKLYLLTYNNQRVPCPTYALKTRLHSGYGQVCMN